MSDRARAVRAMVRGRVQGVGFRDATRRRALKLGVMGWVRNAGDGSLLVHGEKLCGGFALQRTRGGEKPQRLLIKRRDDEARPG